MSDYLTNLLTRTRNLAPVVEPRLSSVFEPATVGGITSRNSFETKSVREAPLAHDRSPQTMPALSQPTGPTTNLPVGDRLGGSLLNEKHKAAGERDESGRSFVQHPIRQASVAPNEISPSSTNPVRSTAVTDSVVLKPIGSPRDSPQVVTTRDAVEGTERLPLAEANDQANWFRIGPKIRQIVDEQLAPFQPSRTRDRDDHEPPSSTAISTLAVKPEIQGNAALTRAAKFESRAEMAASPAALSSIPSINVTIGRVDVRAIMSQPPSHSATRSAQQPRAQSLDEYLKQRSGRGQ